MLEIKNASIGFIALLLMLCLPSTVFSVGSEGCLDCPTIASEVGDYFLKWVTIPEWIAPDSSADIEVSGKISPFTWLVSGDGFSLEYTQGNANILYADSTACGTAEITVSDNYGNSITGYVRCTNGTWGDPIAGCILPGEGNWWTPGFGYEIRGKYKQTQHITNLSGSNFDWAECPTEKCDNACASSPACDPYFGCEPCLYIDQNEIPCTNAGYAGTDCPPACRAWCTCNTVLYYQEWVCP